MKRWQLSGFSELTALIASTATFACVQTQAEPMTNAQSRDVMNTTRPSLSAPIEYVTEVFKRKYGAGVALTQTNVWEVGFLVETVAENKIGADVSRPVYRALALLNTESNRTGVIIVPIFSWDYSNRSNPKLYPLEPSTAAELLSSAKRIQVISDAGKDLAVLANPTWTREQIQNYSPGLQYNVRPLGTVTRLCFRHGPCLTFVWIDHDGMPIYVSWQQVIFSD